MVTHESWAYIALPTVGGDGGGFDEVVAVAVRVVVDLGALGGDGGHEGKSCEDECLHFDRVACV